MVEEGGLVEFAPLLPTPEFDNKYSVAISIYSSTGCHSLGA